MKRVTTLLLALAMGAVLAQSASAANPVRISQIYGGGGGSTGTYIYDYVELFNDSGFPVTIGGWSIEYGSSTGTSFGSTAGNAALIPAGAVIGPCGYYLIQCGAAGSGGVAFPVTPDLVSAGPSMSATAGKVALINNQVIPGPACSGNTSGPIYIDVVGYGGGTGSCFETAPTPLTTNTSVAVRNGDGVVDTDNNLSDFTIQSTGVTTLHNSLSPANTQCLATPNNPSTWGKIKVLYR